MLKEILKKFIPSFFINWYHFCLAFLAAFFYRFPSRLRQGYGGQARKMIVVGVTGTKGKTTTCNLIAQILNSAGLKTGMATTVNFRIGEKEWINATKQTMLGRFQLQKLLAQMFRESCEYAVIETSSEGILQHRHRFIDYNIVVFTNLSPEHIERHGSFENYRAAKLKLFEKVARKKEGIGIYNLDDENVRYFLSLPIKNKVGFTARSEENKIQVDSKFQISDIKLFPNKSEFQFNGEKVEMPLIGKFNVYNAAAAICLALSQNLEMKKIKESLSQIKSPPGRLEAINEGQNFTVIVDYSYEPASLESTLKTVKVFNPNRIIVVFGSAAGGRDKWRRPAMGKIADKLADLIIITTDDPYDEEPLVIIEDISKAILENKKRILGENVFKIINRKEAIKKALSLAKENDLILFAGKGGEQWMNIAGGKKIPWQEAEIVRQELKNFKF